MAQPKSQLIYSSLTLQRNNWQALTLCSQEGLELGGATDKASVVCRSHSVYVSEYYLHQVRVVMIQGHGSVRRLLQSPCSATPSLFECCPTCNNKLRGNGGFVY